MAAPGSSDRVWRRLRGLRTPRQPSEPRERRFWKGESAANQMRVCRNACGRVGRGENPGPTRRTPHRRPLRHRACWGAGEGGAFCGMCPAVWPSHTAPSVTRTPRRVGDGRGCPSVPLSGPVWPFPSTSCAQCGSSCWVHGWPGKCCPRLVPLSLWGHREVPLRLPGASGTGCAARF